MDIARRRLFMAFWRLPCPLLLYVVFNRNDYTCYEIQLCSRFLARDAVSPISERHQALYQAALGLLFQLYLVPDSLFLIRYLFRCHIIGSYCPALRSHFGKSALKSH